MTLPPRKFKPRSIPKKRTKPRRSKAIKCRPHINWVLENYRCIGTGKIFKSTGKPHVCCGPLDPHHYPTRGAGGGDNNISPACRGLHSLIESPGHSQKSVEADLGISFSETGASLWQISPHRRAYELKHEGTHTMRGYPEAAE